MLSHLSISWSIIKCIREVRMKTWSAKWWLIIPQILAGGDQIRDPWDRNRAKRGRSRDLASTTLGAVLQKARRSDEQKLKARKRAASVSHSPVSSVSRGWVFVYRSFKKNNHFLFIFAFHFFLFRWHYRNLLPLPFMICFSVRFLSQSC